MKLQIQLINEETGQEIRVKNMGSQVLYHDSDIHEAGQWARLTAKTLEALPTGREIVNAFYELAGSEIG